MVGHSFRDVLSRIRKVLSVIEDPDAGKYVSFLDRELACADQVLGAHFRENVSDVDNVVTLLTDNNEEVFTKSEYLNNLGFDLSYRHVRDEGNRIKLWKGLTDIQLTCAQSKLLSTVVTSSDFDAMTNIAKQMQENGTQVTIQEVMKDPRAHEVMRRQMDNIFSDPEKLQSLIKVAARQFGIKSVDPDAPIDATELEEARAQFSSMDMKELLTMPTMDGMGLPRPRVTKKD